MDFEIIGDVDHNRLYCTASFTKFLTTFVCLSLLAEKHDLNIVLDDENFLDSLCTNPTTKSFLTLFQTTIGSKFTIRDVCTYYNGLPYTFDLAPDELERVEEGHPFKHHSVMSEDEFLYRCKHYITQVDPNHCKFHYSELAIIFLGYLTEKIHHTTMEALYQRYVLDAYQLEHSLFSRTRPPHADARDLSPLYDYPSIAIMDHGYFCYSNGFFTTLLDQKKLLEGLVDSPIFHVMTDISKARAASNRIMNGLTVEIRIVGDDIIYGYEGLSYSGCNIWAYSAKHKKGYLTTSDDEDGVYDIIYGKFGYTEFDKAPAHTQEIYQHFLASEHFKFTEQAIPAEFIGKYHRVNINESSLPIIFTVGEHFVEIRNPEMIKYDVVFDHGTYRITCRDHMHGTKVGFHRANSGKLYMMFDGTLYKKYSNT